MPDPPTKFFWTPSKKKKYQNLDLPIKLFSLHGQGETICIGKKIQCLPYAGFLI